MATLGSCARENRPCISWTAFVVVLLTILPLQDSHRDAGQIAYAYARELFVHGELTQCQEEAGRYAAQFRISAPALATEFQLLQAQAMLWQGLNADALRVLSAIDPADSNDTVQKLTLEASVLTKRQEFSAANQRLQQAAAVCQATDAPACGTVLRARGVWTIDQGQIATARQFFLQSLAYARSHHDRFLETTALLNLSATDLRSDHFDEAVDWSKNAQRAAKQIGAADLFQGSSGNLGYAYYDLGDYERATELFLAAEGSARNLGDFREQLTWLEDIGLVYETEGDRARAVSVYRQALDLAQRLDSKMDIIISLEDLAYAAIDTGKPDEASTYVNQLVPLAKASGNRFQIMSVTLAQAEIAAAQRQDQQAENLMRTVEKDPASSLSLRLGAEYDRAKLYEVEGHAPEAEATYRQTVAAFDAARAQLKSEDSRLPFVANAESLYASYVHFLVSRGRIAEALAVADQSRAQTLAEGLGLSTAERRAEASHLNPQAVAAKSRATLLFYSLGKQQSYLWAVTPQKTALFTLPPQQQIVAAVERYRQFLIAAKDPLADSNNDGRSLYTMLLAPAAALIRPNSNVVVCVDGALSKLNFETLVAPGVRAGTQPHYWIEDVNVVVAPSLSMLAAARASREHDGKLLLIGDPISASPDYPELPLAGMEMKLVQQHFAVNRETVFARAQATSDAYLHSHPEQYAFIHFVAHGTASRTDPLDSAIVLSPDGTDPTSFKLYARDILAHPIDARLVTVSACYGSGDRAYSGEGLVGLAWGFLRAGAHNVIGALWDVSDESTPRIMNSLYKNVEKSVAPSEALRAAKLDLVRSPGEFHKPFYWAPFQLYTGR